MCIRAYIALKCLFFVAITQFGAIHNQSSGAFFTLWYFLRAKLHYELVSGVTVFPLFFFHLVFVTCFATCHNFHLFVCYYYSYEFKKNSCNDWCNNINVFRNIHWICLSALFPYLSLISLQWTVCPCLEWILPHKNCYVIMISDDYYKTFLCL